MRSNERLQRILAIRQLGGTKAVACAVTEAAPNLANDIRLFALTFACGFLFTSVFLA